ncbi:MAG: DUF192 domain-containing protein [Acidimicrobiia bacterium]
MTWIVRDGEVLAAAELAVSRSARRRGLIGRERLDGALVLRPCRQVHTFGVRFPIDVAFCDRFGRVLRVTTVQRRRVSAPVRDSAMAIEAAAGAFERWRLRPGDVVEVKE